MRKLVFGLFLLALFGAAWSALWFYAAHEAGAGVDRWLKAEDAQGRSWTCPDRQIAGYPFALTINCTAPTFTGTAPDQTATGSVAGLTARVDLLHPSRLDVTFAPPLSYKTSDGGADIHLTWSRLTLSLLGLPDVQTTTLDGRDLAAEGAFARAERQSGHAAQIAASFGQDRTPPGPALAIAMTIGGAVVPGLDAVLGGQGHVDLDLQGRLTQPSAGASARTPEEALDMWRQAGGRVLLGVSRIAHADASVSGSGTLGLDADHRLQGRVDATFVGLDPILKRYGINADLIAAGSLVGALFGGPSLSGPPAKPGTLVLPISFQDGRVGIGPIRTPIALSPIY